uniref:very-long-chain enoyl-CoA reductase-like isoform X1 n=1 Tax=Styela clava TaxID=7725 RepID=UPI001939909E|nr:very-long-chain enoyl-CoA reductase-like isoform X1 [Styela clava]
MDCPVVRKFLSLGGDCAEEQEKKGLEKSVKKMNEILSKSSCHKQANKNSHFSLVEVEIINAKTKQKMCTLERVGNTVGISVLKELFQKKYPQFYTSRQSFRLEPKGKSLKDSDTLADLNLTNECILYFKDLGPQVGWSTVFYCEYAGPLFLYLLFYIRLPFIYGSEYAFKPSEHQVVQIAALCHTIHYAKRLLETKFVHRFSHGTMPIANIFRNSIYYWGFAAWMSYFINHPLYTPPCYGDTQIYTGLAIFIFCELGNLSIHLAFKSLRPAGSTKRQIPKPTMNPFTLMFNLVSCPNYTYEAGSWIGFALMTQTVVGLLFAIVGFMQMAQWALGKHRNYRKEFPDYPRTRKAIVPFIL